MALIGQNSILGNFPSSFECAYARAGYSFSFLLEREKMGVKMGGYIGGGVWGGGKKGGKKGEKRGIFFFSFKFPRLVNFCYFPLNFPLYPKSCNELRELDVILRERGNYFR